MIYLAFGVEGVGKMSGRNELIRRSIEWLTGVSAVANTRHDELAVGALRPNPASDVVEIPLHLDSARHCSVRIYNLRGEVVGNAIDDMMGSGDHMLHIDISQLPSGIYSARVEFLGSNSSRIFSVMH
jgi:hypothetical protein